MRNCATLLFTIIFLSSLQGQAPLMWQQIYGGASIEKGYGVRSCLDQGYIAVGTSSSAGPTDGYIVRTDSLGLVIWAKFYGGANIDIIKAVELLPDSGFIVAGYSNSFGHGGYDGWLMKIDKNGDTLWNKYVGSNDWDFFNDVQTTSDSGFICVGSTFVNGNEDMFVVKFDKYGDTTWTRTYGGARTDQGFEIIETEDTLFAVAAYTESYHDTLGDSWILYMQQNGDTIWTKNAGYPSANDCVYGIAYDSIVNTFFYCGYFTTGTDKGGYWKGLLYSGTEWTTYISNGSADEIFYSMISKDGLNAFACVGSNSTIGSGIPDMMIFTAQPIWNLTSHGTLQTDEAFDIDFTRDGGFIVCGYTDGFNSLVPNLYLVKTDSSGASTMTVGLHEQFVTEQQTGRLSVYPVPATDVLNINLSYSKPAGTQMMLFNSLGEIMDLKNITTPDFNGQNSATVQIDISGLPDGVYYCSALGADSSVLSQRIVIAR